MPAAIVLICHLSFEIRLFSHYGHYNSALKSRKTVGFLTFFKSIWTFNHILNVHDAIFHLLVRTVFICQVHQDRFPALGPLHKWQGPHMAQDDIFHFVVDIETPPRILGSCDSMSRISLYRISFLFHSMLPQLHFIIYAPSRFCFSKRKRPSSGSISLSGVTDHTDAQRRYKYADRQSGDPVHPVCIQAARFLERCKQV